MFSSYSDFNTFKRCHKDLYDDYDDGGKCKFCCPFIIDHSILALAHVSGRAPLLVEKKNSTFNLFQLIFGTIIHRNEPDLSVDHDGVMTADCNEGTSYLLWSSLWLCTTLSFVHKPRRWTNKEVSVTDCGKDGASCGRESCVAP